MNKPYSLYIALLMLVFLNGCSSGDDSGGEVLANFDSGKITRTEFEKAIKNLPERSRVVVKGQEKQFLDSLVTEKLLLNEAEKRGIQHLDEIQALLRQARKRILIAKLLDEEVDSKAATTSEEHKLYYDNNASDFMTPYRTRASHILLRTREEAEAAMGRALAGEDFADLARELSLDPTGPKGGDIGYFQKGQLLAEIGEVAFELKKGELSDIIQTSFGFHIVKLTDISEPRLKNFEAVEVDIKTKLTKEKKSKHFAKLLKKVRSKANIQTNEELLSQITSQNEANDTSPSSS